MRPRASTAPPPSAFRDGRTRVSLDARRSRAIAHPWPCGFARDSPIPFLPHPASALSASPSHRVVVSREGWTGTVDELAELLAERFERPSFRLRMALQRGPTDVALGLGTADARIVLEELSALGVHAWTEEEAGAAPALAAPDRAAAPQGTLVAGPGFALGQNLVDSLGAGPGRTVVGLPTGGPSVTRHAEVGSVDGPEPVPARLRATGSVPAVAPRTGGVEAVVPERAPAASPSGWAAVLGSPPAAPAPMVSGPPAQSPAEPPVGSTSIASEPPAFGADSEAAAFARALPPRPVPEARATVVQGEEIPEGFGGLDEDAPIAFVSGTGASDERPPFHAAGLPWGERPRPPEGQAAWRRLRRPPSSREVAAPTERRIVVASIVAPGAGQALRGEVTRGITFALAGWLVVPWIWSVIDAARTPVRAPEPSAAASHRAAAISIALGWWFAVAALAVGFVSLREVTRPQPVRVAEHPMQVAAPVEVAPAVEEDEPEIDPLEVYAAVRAHVRDADEACAAGAWEACREAADRALSLEEGNRDARRLHVQATLHLLADRGEEADDSAGGEDEPLAVERVPTAP